jgi:hypothetical protein
MQKTDSLDLKQFHYFDNETKHKIGTMTYIVSAHFNENRECLKTKITSLLQNEIEQFVSSHNSFSQSSDI